MNVVACCLAAALALQGGAPAPCDLTDNACKAPHYERRAAETEDMSLRALYLHMAHRSFLALYDKTGRPEYLCAARRAYDRSVAIRAQPDEQRATFVKVLPELEAREEGSDVRCEAVKQRRPKPHAPLLAKPAAPTEPASGGSPAASTALSPAQRPQTSPTPSVALLEPAPEPPVEPLLPVTRKPAERRVGRPLVLAGGVTLGVGLTLVAVAAYTGGRALRAYREGVELQDDVQGRPDDAARARHLELETEYRAMLPLAVGTTVVGGAAVVVGVVLSAVGGRRLAQRSRRTAFLPAFGGLAFRARF